MFGRVTITLGIVPHSTDVHSTRLKQTEHQYCLTRKLSVVQYGKQNCASFCLCTNSADTANEDTAFLQCAAMLALQALY